MKKFKNLLILLTVCANFLFAAWISYNAINTIHEGLQSTLPEKISSGLLMVLLGINTFLILSGRKLHSTIHQN